MTTFTPRMVTVFQRAVEVHWDEVIKRTQRMIEELNIDMLRRTSKTLSLFKGIRLEYEYNFDEDEDEDTVEWDTVEISFRLCFHKENIGVFDSTEKELDKVKQSIQELEGKTFTICECNNRIAVKDGFCPQCYPYAQCHSENCPICLDNNEGIWIELPCHHILHKKCWKANFYHNFKGNEKIPCPLCRAGTGLHDGEEL